MLNFFQKNPKKIGGLYTWLFFGLAMPLALFLISCPFPPPPPPPGPVTVIKEGPDGEPAGQINSSKFEINLQLRNDANLDASFLVLEFSFKFSTSSGLFYKRADYNKYLKQGDIGFFKDSIYESEFSGQDFANLKQVRIESIEFWNTQEDASSSLYNNEYPGQPGVIYE